MKSTQYILIDSSTEPGEKLTKPGEKSKWGKSTACWALSYKLGGPPYEVGLLYSGNEGPNRIFFRGVLAGLEYCIKNDKWNSSDYELVVKGDCKCVIDVLNGTWTAKALKAFNDEAKKLKDRLKSEKRVDVRYEYIPREEKIYQNVDQCAKQARDLIERQFGIKQVRLHT